MEFRAALPSAMAVFSLTFVLLGTFRLDAAVFADADAATHIRYGLEFVRLGGVPATDPILWGAPPLVDPEWLTDLAFAGLWTLGGWTALALVTNAIAAGVLGSVDVILAGRGVPWFVRALVHVLLWAALVSHLVARPHLLTWAAIVAILAACGPDGARLARHPLAIGACLVAGTALWANLHGGFLIGPPLIGALLLSAQLSGARPWRALWIVPAMAFAGAINPWGFDLFSHLIAFLRSDVAAATDDFNLPAPGTAPGVAAAAVTLVVAVAAAAGRPSASEGVWVVGWTVFMWTASRNVAIGALCLVPVVAVLLTRAMPAPLGVAARSLSARVERALREPVAWAGCALGCLLTTAVAWWKPPNPAAFAPVSALAILPERTDGSVFATHLWGGWLSLDKPELLQVVHPLTANHPDEDARFATYLQMFHALEGWRASLDALQVRWVVLPPEAPLVARLMAAGWPVLHADETSVVLTRPSR